MSLHIPDQAPLPDSYGSAFNYVAPLPGNPELVFTGTSFNNSRLECIAYRGGIVAVQHGIQATPDESPLTRKEETVLGMSSIGMTRDEISTALSKSPDTTAGQLRAAYRKLDIPPGGRTSRVAAISRMFETDIFTIQVSTPTDEEPNTPYIQHLVDGGAVDTFVSPITGRPELRSEGNLTRLRLGLPNAKAYLFYAHMVGWLPISRGDGESSGN